MPLHERLRLTEETFLLGISHLNVNNTNSTNEVRRLAVQSSIRHFVLKSHAVIRINVFSIHFGLSNPRVSFHTLPLSFSLSGIVLHFFLQTHCSVTFIRMAQMSFQSFLISELMLTHYNGKGYLCTLLYRLLS